MNLEPLWQPLDIGSVRVKNRVVLTAHALVSSPENLVGQRSIDYYVERARGGVGLILTEAQMVHRSGKGMIPTAQEGWRPEAVERYRRLADAVHPHGAKVFAELGHMGPADQNMLFLDNYRAILSPSGIPTFSTSEIPKPMEQDDFDAVREGFVVSARHALEGGLDGLEIHAAHGFLLSSFLSPGTNKRTDRYGGSTENRCRFLIEIAEAIRAEVGRDVPLGVRISFEEFLPHGIVAEEGERIVETIHATGLFDYFSISGGHLVNVQNQISPMGMPGGILEPFAARTKELVGSEVPVLAVNRITTVEHAAELVENGTADLVAMVRAHLADPFLVAKAQAGDLDDIRECVSCNQGCLGRLFLSRPITCTITPASGREAEWGSGTVVAASRPRKVVVVGAGPAGLKVAEVAAQRGHQVVVLERATELGGNVAYAARLPGRDRWDLLTGSFARRLAAAGVEVRLGTDATVASVTAEEPDVVVLATGATFDRTGFSSGLGFRPGIPGLETTTVLTPVEAISDPERCGDRTIIVDDSGDYLALGLAELLADAGKAVEVVSRHLVVGADTGTTGDLGHVYPRLVEKGVTLTAQHFVDDVADGQARIASVWGGAEHTVAVDSVVLNMGRTPELTLFEQLRGAFGGELHRIGDCSAPRHVDEAIYEGEQLGRAL